VKSGENPQHLSQVTEIWKAVYKDEVVALKILRVPRSDPHVQRTKSVSMSRARPLRRGLSAILTDDVEILQGSSVDEAA